MNQANWIDLRSDTVTEPSESMRDAMPRAAVGDDVYGDDPTVNRLQEYAADLFGYEAALFAPSGTQSNLLALLAHCGRGDEYLVGQEAHTYKYEGGGAAVLGSIQPQPIINQADGSLALADIAAYIKPDDIHFARTKLLALENTIGGRVLPLDYLKQATTLAHERGLATHMDGARICNAAVKLGVSPRAAVAGFDSVSVCLSKGLGAPVGSILCGSKPLIKEATRWRKMLGGGMRQAGVLAAAGLYALEHNVTRLSQDHQNARRLAEGLQELPAVTVEPVQTNILFLQVAPERAEAFIVHLKEHGVLVTGLYQLRMVLHLGVSAAQVEQVIDIAHGFFKAR